MSVPSKTVDGHGTDSLCPSEHGEHGKHVTHSPEERLITFMAGSAQSSSTHDDCTLMDTCQKIQNNYSFLVKCLPAITILIIKPKITINNDKLATNGSPKLMSKVTSGFSP